MWQVILASPDWTNIERELIEVPDYEGSMHYTYVKNCIMERDQGMSSYHTYILAASACNIAGDRYVALIQLQTYRGALEYVAITHHMHEVHVGHA